LLTVTAPKIIKLVTFLAKTMPVSLNSYSSGYAVRSAGKGMIFHGHLLCVEDKYYLILVHEFRSLIDGFDTE
tara:strand:- start:29 stop:244 length:216 start_codon:yes stop_codon:yes gene_type:complete